MVCKLSKRCREINSNPAKLFYSAAWLAKGRTLVFYWGGVNKAFLIKRHNINAFNSIKTIKWDGFQVLPSRAMCKDAVRSSSAHAWKRIFHFDRKVWKQAKIREWGFWSWPQSLVLVLRLIFTFIGRLLVMKNLRRSNIPVDGIYRYIVYSTLVMKISECRIYRNVVYSTLVIKN